MIAATSFGDYPRLDKGRKSPYRWARQAGAALIGIIAVLMVSPVNRANAVPILFHLFEHPTRVSVAVVGCSARFETVVINDAPPHIDPPRIFSAQNERICALPHNSFWWDDVVTPKLLDCRNRSHLKIINIGKCCLHRPSHITRREIASVSDAQVGDNNMLGSGNVLAVGIDPLNIDTQIGALQDSSVRNLCSYAATSSPPQSYGATSKREREDAEPEREKSDRIAGRTLPEGFAFLCFVAASLSGLAAFISFFFCR